MLATLKGPEPTDVILVGICTLCCFLIVFWARCRPIAAKGTTVQVYFETDVFDRQV